MTDPGSSPHEAASQLLNGFMVTQAVVTAVKLGVPDLLADGPRSVGDLAAEAGADATALGRVLRYLTTKGVFVEDEEGVFSNSPTSALFADGVPGSLRDQALFSADVHYPIFSRLADGVRTGESPATIHLGQPFFEWLATEPEKLALFNRWMGSNTEARKTPAIAAVDLSGARMIVDVGGGDGEVLARILARTPKATGVVFDLQQAVDEASTRATRHGLGDRLRFEGGDFFASAPTADAYVLSNVLHDWDDDDATRILRSVRDAGEPGARVVVLEFVLRGAKTPRAVELDVVMLAAFSGGRERTEAEFRALFERAGLGFDSVTEPAAGAPSVIVGHCPRAPTAG